MRRLALVLALLVASVAEAQTGTLTLFPAAAGGSGDVTSVGDCPTGACYPSVAEFTFFAAPTGGGAPSFRAITLADLPATLATDAELAAHEGDADAHHVWPLTDAEVPDSLTLAAASVTAHEAALGIDWSQLASVPAGLDDGDDVGTDDQTAAEVPYTPADGLDWGTDPDDAAEGLDQLALRLTDEEAKADDDVPDAGEVAVSALAPGTDGELITWDASGAPATVAVGTSGHVLTSNGAGAAPTFQAAAGGSGSMPPREFSWTASSLLPLEHAANSIPPLVKVEGAHVDVLAAAFDDATDECRGATFRVADDVDTSGSAIAEWWWTPATPAAEEVVWDYRHVARSSGETWDAALTTVTATASTGSASAAILIKATATTALSTLGWTAGEFVHLEICRDANNGSDDLSGDARLLAFGLVIPRAD